MLLFTLGFLCGDVYLQTLSSLPNKIIIAALICTTAITFIFLRKHVRYSYFFFAIICGFVWSFWYAASVLSWSLPKKLEGKAVFIIGHVASLPQKSLTQTSFLFKVEKSSAIKKNTLIRLAWRHPNKAIKVGDKWQLVVKLKRIHSTQNPGSFDFEAWAIQKKLRASGFVMLDNANKLLAHHVWQCPLDRFRQSLQEKIETNLPNSNTSIWLLALIIGERVGISDTQWQVLRNTGTNHLMAIAGLHIGIIGGFAYYLVSRCWRLMPALILRVPVQQAAACAAMLVAIFYSALAGFSLPTQRACFMLTVFTVALLLRKKISAWQCWSLSLWMVMVINPLNVLSESFWLSFGTIALIIYGMNGRLKPAGLWWKWGRVQWVIGIGLIPFSLWFFQECSLVSFAANCIAIPWLGFFILPFCLLSGIFLFISPLLGKFFLLIADKSLSGLWIVLTWFSELPLSAWQQVIPSSLLFFLTICAFIFLLLPAGFPGRWLSVIWLAPLLCYQPDRPAWRDYWITVLDVGQGLAMVIETKTHTLVYDAGGKISTNLDMGKSVVLPYLHIRSIKKIDMLVISHGDNDHIGGAKSLMHELNVAAIKTSVPEKIPQSQYCLANESWQWDGVRFTFLYPGKDNLDLGNDSSCVLKIDNGEQSILLTGDIEKFAEKTLLQYSPETLSANMLVAPHHGSKTSGLKNFISAVHPHYVLYATGYLNRYHFPHSSITSAYTAINAVQINTADTGMIQFKIQNGKREPILSLYRLASAKYWFDKDIN